MNHTSPMPRKHPTTGPTSRTAQAHRRAFTLVEVLVVIGIIAILAVLALTVGARVAGSSKIHLTKDTLKVLDKALTEYIASKNGMPPPSVLDPRTASQTNKIYIPVIDGREQNDGIIINSVGLFMLQCKGLPNVEKDFAQLDPKVIREYDPNPVKDPAGPPLPNEHPALTTVLDGWGKPMRYVHPALQGAVGATNANPALYAKTTDLIGGAPSGGTYLFTDIRRSYVPGDGPADADGGLCNGARPYFYSAGPDGDPSTIDDNVYLSEPTVQKLKVN